LAKVVRVHVTVPENVPENRTPFGSPPVPLPSMVKVPPDAKLAPFCSDPLDKAPVVKATVPKSPVVNAPPPYPLTATSVDPVRERPAVVPVRVPPPLLKSVPLVAKDRLGNDRDDSNNTAGTRNLLDKRIPNS
jgi:hypothetical protein